MTTNGERSSNISRMSSSSSRSSSIETTVTKLLMSTKHLLQVLTQWSKGAVGGKGVSDAYVQLGNDFKLVSKYFAQHGVSVTDLGDVPMQLRRVLELALRERACDDTLNKYLPRIREIIVTLLDKLKTKQAFLKTMKKDQHMVNQNREHVRNASTVSAISLMSPTSLQENSTLRIHESATKDSVPQNSDEETADPKENDDHHLPTDSAKTLVVPKNYNIESENNDALSQLKKGTTIQRRASKRYSAYHMAKLTSQSTSDAMAAANIPIIVPPADGSDVPDDNRFDTNNKHTDITNHHRRGIEPNDTAVHSNDTNSRYTLFLKIAGKTKKCSTPKLTSLNSLRLLFVERFAYSPGSENFPDIYIRDPVYSEFYELEEHNIKDLKDGSVIELRSQKGGTEMERYFNDFMKEVKGEIKKLHNQLLDVIGSQHENIISPDNSLSSKEILLDSSRETGIDEEQMRYQLSVLKQIYTSNKKETDKRVTDMLAKLEDFKNSPYNTNSTLAASNTYVEKSQDKLGDISESLLSRVDDLQDLIEILRKDVADRGARPSGKRLDLLLKEINAAEKDLQNMQKFLDTEKPHWKKIWEDELDKVCEEQQFLSLQEDLIADLKEDLHRTSETFDLVKLCCEEKDKNPTKSKTAAPVLPLLKPGTFNEVREQMLLAVQSLNPNHESRQDAIERAEKLWEKEKVYKEHDEFKDELGTFVENSSLKKSGGVEAIEKQRQQKDAENLRSNFVGSI